MNERQVVVLALLNNYKNNGNKWISNLDMQGGAFLQKEGVMHVYYPNLSRRISDIKIYGKSLRIDKINNVNGTTYTAYRLTPGTVDVKQLENYINGLIKPIKHSKETLFDKLLEKLGF